jgi:hypothetical protein
MDPNRRNLMKGMLTGGTLLALGIPPGTLASAPAGKAKRCGLLLENSPIHAEFAAGARAAYATCLSAAGAGVHDGEFRVEKLKHGLLNDYEVVAALLEKNRGTRWVAVMSDGSAAVFMELARNAGARLILMGSHAWSGAPGLGAPADIPGLRHVWAAASPGQGAGNILASRLVAEQGSFSITENFFATEHSSTLIEAGGPTANGSVPGFLTWRLEGMEAVHLHCSGLSPSTGCKLLGWDGIGGQSWTPVSGQDYRRATRIKTGESARQQDGQTGSPLNDQPSSGGWVESVGYAVMAAALGSGVLQEPCVSRAFVHRPENDVRAKPAGPATRFTSFVIET